jgi:predicted dehydrogenase
LFVGLMNNAGIERGISMLKIGMVGGGFVAGFHERALCSVRGAELAGVCAPQGAEATAERARADGLGDTQVFKTIAEMCEAVDVVCIFAPNPFHVEIMRYIAKAVEGGAKLKGIICEKPLARNLKEANVMVRIAKALRVPTAYFENQLHMPSVVQARRQLEAVEKTMGAVHLARSAEEHGGPHEPWFWNPTQQGGGVCCDMGCHSIAVGMYMLTPAGRSPDYLTAVSVTANMALLKWGKQPWIGRLEDRGVDYTATPAEDYSNVTFEFKDPETGVCSVAQATNSWMYDAPGLRLLMEAFGPGYSYTVNSLLSPAGLFISDAAAAAIADGELALEKAQATRGALVLQPNEADLYGYVAEWRDALAAFEQGKNALLDFQYGRKVTMLVMAAYMAHEKKTTLDLTKPAVLQSLDEYVPMIQKGEGAKVLFGV